MSAIDLLKQLIAYPTITPKECGIYELVCEILPDFKVLRLDKDVVRNLFLYKDFSLQNAQSLRDKKMHLCFGGHIDVVPAGEGWDSDPFSPTEKDGFLYGRGAQDMKSGVAAFLSAIAHFNHSAKNFNGILSVLLTSDEEGDAVFGTKYVLEKLKELDLVPTFAVVAEPTCVKEAGDTLKIGRRGSINGKIRIQGRQGHVAYPQQCVNPIHLCAPLLPKIADYHLDDGGDGFEPSRIILTDIRGGMEVVNVTPNDLRIMFNVRHSTKTDEKRLRTHIESVFRGLEYTLELKQSSKPFLTNAKSKIVRDLEEILTSQYGHPPILSTSGGTSDARFFAEYGVEVVEYGVCNDTIHSVNERVRISELEELQEIFESLLEKFCSEG